MPLLFHNYGIEEASKNAYYLTYLVTLRLREIFAHVFKHNRYDITPVLNYELDASGWFYHEVQNLSSLAYGYRDLEKWYYLTFAGPNGFS